MSTETHKQTIRDWFKAVNAADETAIMALLTPDFQFKAMARAPQWLIYRWGGQDLLQRRRRCRRCSRRRSSCTLSA